MSGPPTLEYARPEKKSKPPIPASFWLMLLQAPWYLFVGLFFAGIRGGQRIDLLIDTSLYIIVITPSLAAIVLGLRDNLLRHYQKRTNLFRFVNIICVLLATAVTAYFVVFWFDDVWRQLGNSWKSL